MTVKQYLEGAIAKSSKNQAGDKSIIQGTEGLLIVTRVFHKIFSIAARVNPMFYGTKVALVGNAEGWDFPSDAEALYLIRDAQGEEVVVVPIDDPQADTSRPSLVFYGQKFYPAGNTADPGIGAALTAYYARRSSVPASVSESVDSAWDESYDELPILEIAIILAQKDGRTDEVAALRAARDEWLRLYVAHLEHAVSNEVRRWALRRTIHSNTLVPISQLMAGGSDVSL